MWSSNLPDNAWLGHQGPLSHALKLLCTELTVQIISQQLDIASSDEQQLLNIQEKNSFIREILLCGDHVPWVKGRVVAPYTTYLRFKPELDLLGNKLLGETILYNKNEVIRSKFEYMQDDNNLWARRSVFDLAGYKLMVMETFLPKLPSYKSVSNV